MDEQSNLIYIFGYGSLVGLEHLVKIFHSTLNSEEKVNRIINSIRFVRIKDIERGWFLHKNYYKSKKINWTVLAAIEKKGCTCNGIIFEIDSEQLRIIDKIEIGYIKKTIPKSNITILSGSELDSRPIHYYSIDESKISGPNEEFPIIQSYTNLCLEGFKTADFILGKSNLDFTKEFINTTSNWKELKYYISND